MKKRLIVFISLLATLVMVFTCATAGKDDTVTISKEEYEKYQQFKDLVSIMDNVDAGFYEDADHELMLQGAAWGMLAVLEDPYTFYYPPEDYAEVWEAKEDDYVGVGMLITSNYDTNICTVSRVFKNSPAMTAGVHRGDILYRFGEIMINPTNVSEIVDQIRGEEGTEVSITFLRDGEEITISMIRGHVQTTWVESTMLEDDIGYMLLYQFEGKCSDQFKLELNELIDSGAKGIILDLRDNPGGWLDCAQAIGDLFLDRGVLCYLEYKDGTREYTRTGRGHVDVELVVLVNENSASAAELLAGALRDRADADIVGVQSYGKGIAQVVLSLPDSDAGMQMTVAKYYTPNGICIHKIGLTPDVVVEPDPDSDGTYDIGDLSDPQLSAALDVMHDKLK